MRGTISELGFVLFLGMCCQAGAVNGVAVSSFQDPSRQNTDAMFFYGAIVKYTIANDQVSKCDTIYKKYWSVYPKLNLQGTMCAFIRKNVGGPNPDLTKDISINLSVMDIDGSNVFDLDTFPACECLECREFRSQICWPAGDYIYYTKQMRFPDRPPENQPTMEVWKVRYNMPSSRARVVTYEDARTFGMSLDATRAGITDLSNSEFHCLPHAFPPATPPTKAGWDTKVWEGCGTYISPSGKYHQHFYEPGHAGFRINTWNPPNVLLATVDVIASDFPQWSVDPALTAEKIGSGDGDMEWARWAVNSDKWITGCTKLSNGYNQVLVNWIDHKVIVTSRNWRSIAIPARSNDPGDFWVAGGPCGSYEDVNGNWAPTSVSSGCATKTVHRPVQAMAGDILFPQGVNVYSVQGALLGTAERAGILSNNGSAMGNAKMPNADCVGGGVYVIRRTDGTAFRCVQADPERSGFRRR